MVPREETYSDRQMGCHLPHSADDSSVDSGIHLLRKAQRPLLWCLILLLETLGPLEHISSTEPGCPVLEPTRRHPFQASNQRTTNMLDEGLALESSRLLLRLTTPAANHTTAGPRAKDSREPKCTLHNQVINSYVGSILSKNHVQRTRIDALLPSRKTRRGHR